MKEKLVLSALLISLSLLTLPVVNIGPVYASHGSSFTLYANQNSWNFSRPSGSNPTLTVLANDTLRRTFTVGVIWDEAPGSLVFHNFAIYQQGGNAIARSPDVTDAVRTTTDIYQISKGVYSYFCEYHPFPMEGVIKAIQPDVDGDGDVDIDDLIATFLNQFGTNLAYDIDLDGDVDIDDLILVFLHQFI